MTYAEDCLTSKLTFVTAILQWLVCILGYREGGRLGSDEGVTTPVDFGIERGLGF